MRDIVFELPDRSEIKQYIITPEQVRSLEAKDASEPIEVRPAKSASKRKKPKPKAQPRPRRKNTA